MNQVSVKSRRSFIAQRGNTKRTYRGGRDRGEDRRDGDFLILIPEIYRRQRRPDHKRKAKGAALSEERAAEARNIPEV